MNTDELRRLIAAATPGPWSYHCRDHEGRDSWFLGWHVDGPPEAERGQFERGADAAFIAAARSAVPELLTRLAQAEAALAQAQEREKALHRVWDVLGAGWAYADHLLACASLQWPPSVCDCGYTEMEASIERVLAAALAPEQKP